MQLRFQTTAPVGAVQAVSGLDVITINASGNVIIRNGGRIETDQVRALDASGLTLFNTSGLGMVIQDTTGHIVVSNGVRIETDEVRARDNSGLTLANNGGGLGVYIQHSTGRVGIGTNNPFHSGSGACIDVDGTSMRIRQSRTPSSAGDSGDIGEWGWDANYFYLCINTNTWRRIQHFTWP